MNKNYIDHGNFQLIDHFFEINFKKRFDFDSFVTKRSTHLIFVIPFNNI